MICFLLFRQLKAPPRLIISLKNAQTSFKFCFPHSQQKAFVALWCRAGLLWKWLTELLHLSINYVSERGRVHMYMYKLCTLRQNGPANVFTVFICQRGSHRWKNYLTDAQGRHPHRVEDSVSPQLTCEGWIMCRLRFSNWQIKAHFCLL